MRKVIFVQFMVVIIIFFSIFSVEYLEKSSQELIVQLGVLEKALVGEEWQETKNNLEIFKEKWEKAKFMWSILIDHQEIDNIELSISHIGSYLSSQNSTELKAEIKGLYLFLKHIPEIEKLTLENFL